MAAPVTRPPASKEISVNFPNREELSFLDVLAFPNASSKGLDSSTCVLQEAAFSPVLMWQHYLHGLGTPSVHV